MKKSLAFTAMAGVLAICTTIAAAEEREVSTQVVDQIQSWANSSDIVAAILTQNAKHANLTQGEIDKLDKTWRAETKSSEQPMITAVLGKPLSTYLKKVKKEAGGRYSEIFVMDDKGLNVGQSDVTSDYWQGDEAKWKKSYAAGAGAVFVDKVEFDESSQAYQSQVSIAVVDPKTNKVIGAVTVGVNVEG